MPVFKWLKKRAIKKKLNNITRDLSDDDNDDRQQEEKISQDEEVTHHVQTELVYFTSSTPNQNLIDILSKSYKDVQTFTDEIKCVEHIKSTSNQIFLIIDGIPSTTLIEAIQSLIQIDSVFIYSPSSDALSAINQKSHNYLLNSCKSDSMLLDSIKKSLEDFEKQAAIFNMFNKKDKPIYDLSIEQNSFLFVQLFKFGLKNMPNTNEAKKAMIDICRNYYRGNLTELVNIDEFDQLYKSSEAIVWFAKDTFICKFVNKTLRTQDVELMYEFRFFITDFSKQLELKFRELKEKQKDILKLYRGSKLSQDEVSYYQNSVGNLIANSAYLSTSGERSVAYSFATKFVKLEGFVRALFEYTVDLNVVQNIIVADIREYSAFPEEAEFIFDYGSVFQIDSCEYDATEDLWHIKLHATNLNSEYIEYQKKRMIESTISLFFGNLLLEMGEYAKAERYLCKILHLSNPNDEEIACMFFYFGCVHRLQGDFHRAIDCYNRAYKFNMTARPERLASAGKCLNGLGIVYSEMGRQVRAEECFQGALELYKVSIPKDHPDVAGTLINLGAIDCDRQNLKEALDKYQEVTRIYDRHLPPDHPSRARVRVGLGNVHMASGIYTMALQEYEAALKLQEAFLSADHADKARILHNLAIVHTHLGNKEEAKKYSERVNEIVDETSSLKLLLQS
ncbi:unnamed protein product [Rotaria sordida]|uniref:Uncharacterized protein n=1 Tax=Rotaria sordida TaxID=392033 RepID=A0A814QCJ8_9BILA|nr:unnamed protein product [Rotaria sordida]